MIFDGVTYYDTTGATTDGHAEPSCAFPAGDDQINQDIWYDYQAPCTGHLGIRLCGSLYDTKVAVYAEDDCPEEPEDPVACNDDDDFCGDGSLQSKVLFPVMLGESYKIRVGGFETATGPGQIEITCGDPPPNDNCEDVTIEDLAIGSSLEFFGTNELATNDCWLFEGAHVWIAFNLLEDAAVILEYCWTDPPFTSAWDSFALFCPCEGEYGQASCLTACDPPSNPNPFMSWSCLPAFEYYYYPVLADWTSEGSYWIRVSALPCDSTLEACCYSGDSCVECEPWCCPADHGGVPQGPGSSCGGVKPCCLTDGSCVESDSVCCDDLGGTPQETGTCTQPQACFLPDDTCVMADPLCCESELAGTPGWPGSACPGDIDGDGDVDLDDYAVFSVCLNGPQVPTPPPGCTQEQFDLADLLGDNDVDLADFAAFQEAFTGP